MATQSGINTGKTQSDEFILKLKEYFSKFRYRESIMIQITKIRKKNRYCDL